MLAGTVLGSMITWSHLFYRVVIDEMMIMFVKVTMK